MKKQLGIMLGIAALLPVAGMANITVTAAGQTTGYAYIYDVNPASANYQTIVARADFNGSGVADIPTGSIPFSEYGIAMDYDGDGKWVSNIAPGGDGYKLYGAGAVDTATAVTGSITARSFTPTTTTLTLNSNGDQHIYNGPNGSEIGATMGLYRPALVVGDADVSKSWNTANLEAGFEYDVTPVDATFDIITLHNMSGAADFTAQYLAQEVVSGVYNLFFEQLAYGDGINTGGSGNDLVLSIATGAATTDDATPYYVIADKVYMYDSDAGDADYSEMLDGGLSLTDPQHYVIPEPATMMLILGAGSCLLAIRRVFII